jgi:predicted alpha/beta superfamily hydrolase
VTLPVGYEAHGADLYPVLYVIDGNLTAATLAPYVEWYSYDLIESVTPFIVVSIGYGNVTTRTWLTKRARDLVPAGEPMSSSTIESLYANQAFANWTDEERQQYIESARGGHADRFLAFLENELAPAVEQRYRVDRRRVGLWGYSYGGLFALYAVFKQSGLFASIGASSPAVLTPESQVFAVEKQASTSGEVSPVFLHLSLNAVELTGKDAGCRAFAIQFARLVDVLYGNALDGLRFEARILTGESHATGWTQSFLTFVRSVYSRE